MVCLPNIIVHFRAQRLPGLNGSTTQLPRLCHATNLSTLHQQCSTLVAVHWYMYVSVMSQPAVLLSISVLVCVFYAHSTLYRYMYIHNMYMYVSLVTHYHYVFCSPPPSSLISLSFNWIHTPRAASHSLFWTKLLKLFNVTQMNKRTINMNSANIKTITRIEEKTYWSMDVVAWYGLSLSV